ncbi:FAD:protein FMN transferase [Pedobacter sp. AW31-3R]|uniref:FAD:protein FMN transferase n=1 Tax=Pedobacter sp. AW31-3R TaxID=3445781 RepID=UPI003F9FCEF6
MQRQPQIVCSPTLFKAQTDYLFHANIKIKLPADCPDSLFDHLFHLLEDIDVRYNSYSADSYFDRINRNAGTFVEVDEDTVAMLNTIAEVSAISGGTYDISVMPLLQLWGFYKEQVTNIPEAHAITAALEKVDYRSVSIRGNEVKINKGQQLMTGSFLKAFAVDRVVEFLADEGIPDAMINAGGSTIYGRKAAATDHWKVNVIGSKEDPDPIYRIRLQNHCYSTSAQLSNKLVVDGKSYGHILNARTGYPSSNKQMGLVSKSAFIGDICSTALFNTDRSNFLHAIGKLKERFDLEGFLMDQYNDLTMSHGFTRYIDQE